MLPATIRYSCDPEDGWPIISKVEAAKVVTEHYDGHGKWLNPPKQERVPVDVTPVLDEYQLHVYAVKVNDALKADTTPKTMTIQPIAAARVPSVFAAPYFV